MLILTRKIGQSIMIGDDIEIVITDSTARGIRVGISAPHSLPVYRREIYDERKRITND